MPTIASFIEAAKAALLAGDAAQAATVCRHVLGHFPKHIEANCLLAEALRDLGETSAARELFLRVVSADPANLVAHWALGLIAESEGDLEWAAWELARAWDSNPGYAELRGEILRVTGSHPGLTALALGQQYADAGLFDKAIAELRAALTAEPTRLDVALALATVLWRADQRDAAAEVCAAVLADSPDCLMANVLLGVHLSALAVATGAPVTSRVNGGNGANGSVAAGGRLKGGRDVESVAVAKGRRLLERAARLDPGGAKTAELLGADLVPPDLKVTTDLPSIDGAAAEPTEETPWIEEADEKPTTVQAALESRLATAAASRPDADLQAMQSLDPSWQELLTEEIVLDADAEARLNQALREMGLPTGDKLDEGWLEVSTAADGSTSSLTDQLGQIAPTAPEAASRSFADESATAPQTARAVAVATPDHAADTWRSGDVDAALAEYRLLLADRPDVADLVVEGLHQLLEAHPDSQEAHRILGDAYMRAGRFQQAIDEYNWVLAKS